MPKLLVQRFAADSISQFRIAAVVRDQDAERLATGGHHAAAIYLWGYVAEMTLKAAWFALIGFQQHQAITVSDLNWARTSAKQSRIPWPGNFHALENWASLLVQYRITLKGPYPDPKFGDNVLLHSRRVYARWRETLRYKKNRAHPAAAKVVRDSARWLLYNSRRL